MKFRMEQPRFNESGLFFLVVSALIYFPNTIRNECIYPHGGE